MKTWQTLVIIEESLVSINKTLPLGQAFTLVLNLKLEDLQKVA
jgi:hypothetical protein